jgi:hypothetical protein
MNWLALQTMTQISVERILNALPEGLLIAFFAWALLRVLRKQNSGTRFAVWFLALLTVAVLPLLGGFGEGRTLLAPGMSQGHLHPAITIPGSWALFACIAWALGTSVALARLAAGLWCLRQLRRSCTAIAVADLDPIVRKTVEALGAACSVESKAVTIATSEEVRVPAAIGFWKPTIVLPVWALPELPPEDLNVILRHEFAHLRRGDDWTNLIQKIVRSIFFFHPAVWWIESRLSVEREMACDDAVLAETSNPHGYASCLVSLMERSLAHRRAQERWSMAQAVVHRAREASLRLAQILDTNRPVATRVWKPALSMVAVFAMVCLALLPHTPQFVAFDRPAGVGTIALARPSRAQLGSSLPSQQLRISDGESSSVSMTAKETTAKVVRARTAAGNGLVPTRAIAARWNTNAAPPAPVVQVGANADQQVMPQFQTLVFIEATEYRAANSSVWNVQVWRVTFVSAVHERLVSVPVVNSI